MAGVVGDFWGVGPWPGVTPLRGWLFAALSGSRNKFRVWKGETGLKPVGAPVEPGKIRPCAMDGTAVCAAASPGCNHSAFATPDHRPLAAK